MRKKDRALRRNLLVVCEGSVTEPEYFAFLRKMALENGVWAEIEIRPKPRSETQEAEQPPNPHKSPRPKRQLQPARILEEADATESRFAWRQTPVNFVKEARDGLKDEIFEEVWTVFDRNGHPAHEQAFALAREPIGSKIVNIAFSSVAFEHWILLHFEQNDTAFEKSECKDEGGRYLNCGTGENPGDCWGGRCIAGHLRAGAHIEGSTKKGGEDSRGVLQKLLESERRRQAVENAAWLRYKIAHDPEQAFLTNPFTSVDALLKRFLGDDTQIEWAKQGEQKALESLLILIDMPENRLECTIFNQGNASRLFNGHDIAAFVRKNGGKFACTPQPGSEVLIPDGASRTFKFGAETAWQGAVFEIVSGNHCLLVELF